LAFDAKPQVVMAMGAAPDPDALQAALAAVRPGGSTAISPAFETALQWFGARGGTARRHIVLISDGRTSDEDATRLRALVRSGGIEVSAVAIGDSANRALLEELAASTGGRAYFPARLSELPAAVAREAARAAGGGIVQERFTPRATSHPILEGIDAAALPLVGGYVVSATKPTASAILSSHLGDPVLAAWRTGLGRVAVFTAGLESPWSVDLRSWRSGGQLWSQTVRWLSRGSAGAALRIRIQDDGMAPRVVVEAERPDGAAEHFGSIEAIVRSPGGTATEVAIDPVAPGRYAARLPVDDPGTYVVAVTATDDRTGVEHRAVRALDWSADREIQSRGTDQALLSRLAATTGGRVLLENQSPFDGPRPRGYVDATWWLAAAALAMFVLDVASAGELMRRGWRRWRHRHSAAAERLSA
jgi:hypothetical protein